MIRKVFGTSEGAAAVQFSGPLVGLAGPKRVEDGFRRHAEALKKRCEGSTPSHP